MAKTPEDPRGTRERVLRSAETLFAERGFEIVSLRDITGAADANVAAVNYHFGSKEKLIDAVIERHVVPINEERMELLNRFFHRCCDTSQVGKCPKSSLENSWAASLGSVVTDSRNPSVPCSG